MEIFTEINTFGYTCCNYCKLLNPFGDISFKGTVKENCKGIQTES